MLIIDPGMHYIFWETYNGTVQSFRNSCIFVEPVDVTVENFLITLSGKMEGV